MVVQILSALTCVVPTSGVAPTKVFFEAAQQGDVVKLRALLSQGTSVDVRDSEGATALMRASFYGHTDAVRLLLERGADVNAKNEAGATALLWGVASPETVQVLLDHGANPNAQIQSGHSALITAANTDGLSGVANLLVAKGADVNLASKSRFTPLISAAYGDPQLVELLIQKGAEVGARNSAGWTALHGAATNGNVRIARALLKNGASVNAQDKLNGTTPLMWAAASGVAELVQLLLDHGAEVNVREKFHGGTALTWASALQPGNPEMVKVLLRAGANPNVRDEDGNDALEWARRQGNPEVIRLLVGDAGLSVPRSLTPSPTYVGNANTVRAAILRSIPLLQRVGPSFVSHAPEGCVSCHHQSLPAVAIAMAQNRGFAVDKTTERNQAIATVDELSPRRDRLLLGVGAADPLDPAYFLLGLSAAQYPADSTTDAMVHFLILKQQRDGRWHNAFHRPPIDDSDFTSTAVNLRALQLFAPKQQLEAVGQRIERAAQWLASASPKTTEDRVFQLLGLIWTNRGASAISARVTELRSMQRSDGGWAQLPELGSDAYATGEALFALRRAGGLKANDPGYLRGIRFLLRGQWTDGSWFVPTRSLPVQPYFESGFPHGKSQFISCAATAWATLALLASLPAEGMDSRQRTF